MFGYILVLVTRFRGTLVPLRGIQNSKFKIQNAYRVRINCLSELDISGDSPNYGINKIRRASYLQVSD